MIDVLEVLRNAKLKKTKVRVDLLDILSTASQLYTAQELYLMLVENDKSVNLSTVYRTLEKLVSVQVVNQVLLENSKSTLYEFNHKTHHHFLVCDDCNKVIVVQDCPIDHYEDKIEESHGFKVSKHKLEFHGTCHECSE